MSFFQVVYTDFQVRFPVLFNPCAYIEKYLNIFQFCMIATHQQQPTTQVLIGQQSSK